MENVKLGMLDGFLTTTRSHHKSLKSLFSRNKSNGDDQDSPSFAVNSPKPIPQLSTLANSVVSRCSKILQIPTEELQHHFDTQLPESVKELLTYARNFLEFCSYQALHIVSCRPDYLSDKEFRCMTFDMMLAWESPSAESKPQDKETASCSNQDSEDEDGWSLFYSSSTNMAMQVDDKKTVGLEAFARIAPACAAVADIITVHNLYDALTSSSGHRLHFLVYDKYIRSLDKVIKASKNALTSSIGNLQLTEGEMVLDVDGTVPTQPVLQHIGMSMWPGRLTLTNSALYFESLGVGLYEKAVRYDLATDMKQVIKPELTGPLGARLFDKAIMYKSTSIAEPVYLEFPEFKGNSRRDYWLDICLEILRAHRFIRKNNFKETKKSEVMARAILGICRYRAVREAFHFFSSHYKTLLAFNLAESLPGGDLILKTLSSRLVLLNSSPAQHDVSGSPYAKRQPKLSPVSLIALTQLGFILEKEGNLEGEAIMVGDICVGEINPLEMAVKQSLLDTGRAEAAQATVEQVKVDGIDTNVAIMKMGKDEGIFPSSGSELLNLILNGDKCIVLNQRIEKSIEPVQYFEQAVLMRKQLLMAKLSDIFSLYLVVCFCFNRTPYYNVDRDKMDLNRLCAVTKFLFPPELLFPVIEVATRVQLLASWEHPYKSTAFLMLTCYSILRGWIRYILPSVFVFVAVLMLWCRHFNKGRPLEPFKITPPHNRNAVEQLLTLQEAITQVEALLRAGNIVLLKLRALLFAVLPQATDRIVLLLVFMAAVIAFVPLKYIILVVFVEAFTREMPYRKESSDRWVRRIREWWVRIPAAPVQLIKPDDNKKKKS